MAKLRIGLIGGSGLGEALGAEEGDRRAVHTPFGEPSSAIVMTEWKGVEVAILQRHGPGHRYNPSAVPYRANMYALKQLGVTHVLASGATGSLREEIRPRDLVIVDQFIDKTTRRAHTFYEHAAVHVEFAEPICPVMRKWLIGAKQQANTNKHTDRLDMVRVHDGGTYICMEGPAFSTKAESNMHRLWGGDLIGMTAMPEAKLAREAELPYALIALPTDYDCWRPHDEDVTPTQLLDEITGNLKAATENSITLIKAALADTTILHEQVSPASDALKLAIWSQKAKISAEEIERLGVLWGRYFS